jgi:hypothetical protein
MSKSRPIPSPNARPHTSRMSMKGGDGDFVLETDAERFARFEVLLERMQQTLDLQFQRIAELQVVLDRLATPRDH